MVARIDSGWHARVYSDLWSLIVTAEDTLALELRNEMEARLSSWKNERERLILAPLRIAELDELIALAEKNDATVKVAPRPTKLSAEAESEVRTK